MWDNLRAHKTHGVSVCVREARGGVAGGPGPHLNLMSLCRPSYNPPLGPIEYIFGLVEQELRRHQWDVTDANMYAQLHAAIRRVVTPENCDAIFRHCGL